MTHDIDIVVQLGLADVTRFVATFPLDDFYCPPEDVLAIEIQRGSRGHCNLIHHETGFKADVYIAFDELHRWALANRRAVEIDGMQMQLAPPEYVIVRKLEYYREGKSDKHVRDIRGILATSASIIDRALLEQQVRERGLAAEWQHVLGS